MTQTRTAVVTLALAIAGAVWNGVAARESNGIPAARALVADGDAAAKAGKLSDAINAFRKAIDLDPDYVDAHQRYIETTERQEDPSNRTPVVPRLRQQYEQWARRYPKRAVYQLPVSRSLRSRATGRGRNRCTVSKARPRRSCSIAKGGSCSGPRSTTPRRG